MKPSKHAVRTEKWTEVNNINTGFGPSIDTFGLDAILKSEKYNRNGK